MRVGYVVLVVAHMFNHSRILLPKPSDIRPWKALQRFLWFRIYLGSKLRTLGVSVGQSSDQVRCDFQKRNAGAGKFHGATRLGCPSAHESREASKLELITT